jgi:sarcosine oxidase, subunit beta
VDPPAEFVIVGAGIAGAALAHELSRRSLGRVVVFDPRPAASGATGRAAGILTEQLWDPWDIDVVRSTKELYGSLSARRDPTAYTVNGFVRWASEPAPAEALDAAARLWRGWGVKVEPLDAAALAERIPGGWFADVRRAYWTPADAVVAPSTMTQLLLDEARGSGAEIRLGAPFKSMRRAAGVWEIETAERTIRARHAIVAAGAWTKALLKRIGHPQPIAPYRTQAAVLRSSPRTDLGPSVHDIDLDVYARPEGPGRLLVGDGTELAEVDPETAPTGAEPEFLSEVGAALERRLPLWVDAELLRAWSGVCTATPDRRPLAGPVPGAESLFITTGFNGFGVMRAGGIAQRLAEALSSNDLSGIDPVLPGRFEGHHARFAIRPGFTLEAGPNPRY